MWEHLSRKTTELYNGTLILLGEEAASTFKQFGPPSLPTEMVTFHRLISPSEDGSATSSTNVLRVRKPEPSIVKDIPFSEPIVVICALSWGETDCWPSHIETLSSVCKELGAKAKPLITTTNYSKYIGFSHAVAALNKSLDLCHQYLRASALKLNASLVYTTDNDDNGGDGDEHTSLNLKVVVSRIMSPSFPENIKPEDESYHGNRVIIYGNDSKEKILAVDPEFDFDSAYNNKMTVPPIWSSDKKDTSSRRENQKSLPEELSETLSEFGSTRQLPEPSISRAVLDEADDKKVISKFFSTIAQRSS